MFKIAVVIFREFLEISILLGIIFAATKNIKNRTTYITLGVMSGVIGSAVIAFFVRILNRSFHNLGDEILNASILLFTVFAIILTTLSINRTSRGIKNHINEVIANIENEKVSKVILTLVVASTIFREGVEILLFTYSISHSSSVDGQYYLLSIGLAALGGICCGTAFYFGLLRFAGKYIFKACFVLLSFIAAGLAAEAAGILTSSGIIKMWYKPLWNTSSFISDSSLLGKVLKVFLGYESTPNGMQLVFYFSTLVLLFSIATLQSRKSKVV